ncbi:MAG: peptide chain release factor N(5)-glutamine methyltransferase, partial [Bacteroidota bacterium]
MMSANVLNFEPHVALFVRNEDPLIFYRQIAKFTTIQTGNVSVFLECNEFNAHRVADLFDATYKCEVIQDMQGKDRIVKVT